MSDTIPKVKPAKIEEPAAWYAGSNEDYMNIGGPYKTREEAIAEGRNDKDGEPFYICNAALYGWSAPDAEDVIDHWVNDHDELWWEDGFSGFDGHKDLEAVARNDLQTVLNEWFERHRVILPTPTAFCIHTGGEWIDQPEPVEGTPTMTTIPDDVGREAVRLLNEECRGIYAWPRDADIPSIITVAKLLMKPPAPMADLDEEAAKRVVVEFLHGSGPDESFARATEQMRKEREAWEAGRP